MTAPRLRRLTITVALAALAVGGGWTLGAQGAAAAGTGRYVATTGSDSNACTAAAPCKTVQHAVDIAGDGDTIHVAAGTYPESVLVSSDAENDPNNLTIAGAGAGSTKITGNPNGSPNLGIGNDGFINANFGIAFEGVSGAVRNLTVGDVPQTGSNPAKEGIGIVTVGAQETQARAAADPAVPTLNLAGVAATHNSGGGVIAFFSDVTASASQFDDNGTAFAGSQAENEGFGVGAIAGDLTMATSTASGNHGFGVIAEETDSARVSASTIAGNDGPGLVSLGVVASSVYDSTVAGNVGQAIGVVEGVTDVTHSTITGTKKSTGNEVGLPIPAGAISVATDVSDARRAAAKAPLRVLSRRAARARPAADAPPTTTVNLAASIVADNATPDCSQKITDLGYNISSDAANSCGLAAKNHSLAKTNPDLGPLGAHGGPTQTQLPLKASPAIDAQPDDTSGCSDASRDQRGVLRPAPTGGRCDIGSVELAGAKLAITTDSLPHGTVGKSYSATVHATGGQYPTYTWSLADGTLPPGITFHDGTFSGTPGEAGTYKVTVSVNDPVTRSYTIVIDAAGDHGNGTGSKLADTGIPTLELTGIGALLLVLGLAVLYQSRLIGLGNGRHRRR